MVCRFDRYVSDSFDLDFELEEWSLQNQLRSSLTLQWLDSLESEGFTQATISERQHEQGN